MEPTPRSDLPYSDDDVAEATERLPHTGHRGTIGLRVDIDPDWDEVAAVVDDAYRKVAPRTLVRQLDEPT